MRLKTWGTLLELKNNKSTLTETDRIKKIAEFIEELSSKKCFGKPSEKKDCSCLSLLQGDDVSQEAIASYILYWAQKTPFEQKMMLVEKINGVLLAEQLTKTKIINSRQTDGKDVVFPFAVPFFATNIEETDKKLNSIFICKESLAALHHYGKYTLASLVKHAKEKTRPVHGNVGRVNSITNIHRENVVPLLEEFFKKSFPMQDPDQHSSRIIFSQKK